MMVEQRKDLGDTRLARQVGIVVLLLMLAGIALNAFSPDLHWRAVGTLFTGLGLGLLVGPRLAIWKA